MNSWYEPLGSKKGIALREQLVVDVDHGAAEQGQAMAVDDQVVVSVQPIVAVRVNADELRLPQRSLVQGEGACEGGANVIVQSCLRGEIDDRQRARDRIEDLLDGASGAFREHQSKRIVTLCGDLQCLLQEIHIEGAIQLQQQSQVVVGRRAR